jgi:hypothetical protein
MGQGLELTESRFEDCSILNVGLESEAFLTTAGCHLGQLHEQTLASEL